MKKANKRGRFWQSARFFILIVMTFLMFHSFQNPVQAQNSLTINKIKDDRKTVETCSLWIPKGLIKIEAERPDDFTFVFFKYYLEDYSGNKSVFCMNPNAHNGSFPVKVTPDADITKHLLNEYYFDEATARQMHYDLCNITYYGFQKTDQSMRDYIYTQLMIWEQLGCHASFKDDQECMDYLSRKRQIMETIAAAPSRPSFHGAQVKIRGKESAWIEDSSGTLKTYMQNSGYSPNSAIETGQGLKVMWDGNNRLKLLAAAGQSGEMQINFPDAPGQSFTLLQPYFQTKISTAATPGVRGFTLHATVIPLGQLSVQKTGEALIDFEEENLSGGRLLYTPVYQEVPLNGAVFELRNAEAVEGENGLIAAGELVLTGQTNENGQCLFSDLPTGLYEVRELSPPEGYWTDERVHTVEVYAADPQLSPVLNVQNIRKRYHVSANKVFDNTLGLADHELTDNCLFGLYTQEELKARKRSLPAGSLIALSKPQLSPSPAAEGEGSVHIVLPDQLETVPSLTAHVSFELPSAGSYKLIELQTPEGFIPAEPAVLMTDDTEWTFNGQDTFDYQLPDVLNKRKLSELRIQKWGSDGIEKYSLPGAVFEFSYKSDDNQVLYRCEAVTDEKGEITFAQLVPGKWEIREIRAPEGYLLNPDITELWVEKEGENASVEFINIKQKPAIPLTLIPKETSPDLPPAESASIPAAAPPAETAPVYSSPPSIPEVPSPDVIPQAPPALSRLELAKQPALPPLTKVAVLPKTGEDGFPPQLMLTLFAMSFLMLGATVKRL